MSNEWADMLAKHGIVDEGNGARVSDAGLDAAGAAPQLVDLTHFTVVEITGEDAPAFLQGQLCNDLSVVTPMHAQITGYCTPKGRLLALPIIVGTQNGFRMLVLQSVKESFLKRLRMFVMRSKVQITESEDWLCSGVIADEAGSVGAAASWTGGLPGAAMDVATADTQQVIRWHDVVSGTDGGQTRARYILLASKADQIELWNSCPELPKRSHLQWRYGDITAGVPSISPGVSEAFVPQMLNLQLINALSFTKGCYPGQEIVARMQYLGKLKRHMRQFYRPSDTATEAEPVVPGDTLSSDVDKDAGVVVDAVTDTHGQTAILAVMKVSSNEATVTINDTELVPVELPYALPSMAESAPVPDK